MELNIIIYLLYAVAFVNFILSTIILARGLKYRVSMLYGLILLSISIWSFSIAAFYSITPFFGNSALWILITHSSGLFFALMFFYFSASFPRKIIPDSILIISILPFLILNYFIFNGMSIIGIPAGLTYEIFSNYAYYALLLSSYFLFGYFFLFLQLKSTKDPKKQKNIIYILTTAVVVSILAMITDLVLPYFNIFNYIWLGPLFTFALAIVIFFAILKYHLFNIKIITTELLTFSVWIIVAFQTLFSNSATDMLINSILLITVITLGIFLIKGVIKEVEQREEIEKLAEDLKKANERLHELDKLKSEFVSIASHQLRSPLTAMKGYASLLLEGSYGKFPDKAREPLSRIFESTNLMVESVDDFLNVSRIEQGKMKYNKTDFDITELVNTVVAELTSVAKEKGLSLSFDIKNTPPFKINADLGKIKQVLYNLLDNSIKYTPEGSIEVTVLNKGDFIQFKIKDTGVGISKETLAILFDKFVRADNAHKVNVLGTGLGLYVAKQMVEAHGGKIWAESDGEGKGSSFFVELKTV